MTSQVCDTNGTCRHECDDFCEDLRDDLWEGGCEHVCRTERQRLVEDAMAQVKTPADKVAAALRSATFTVVHGTAGADLTTLLEDAALTLATGTEDAAGTPTLLARPARASRGRHVPRSVPSYTVETQTLTAGVAYTVATDWAREFPGGVVVFDGSLDGALTEPGLVPALAAAVERHGCSVVVAVTAPACLVPQGLLEAADLVLEVVPSWPYATFVSATVEGVRL